MTLAAVDDAWLKRHLGSTGADPDRVAARVRREPGRIATLLRGIDADSAPVRFGSSKVLKALSKTSPSMLYAYFDFFAGRMAAENRVLAWDATRILANLAAVDEARKIASQLDRYLSIVRGPQMIAAATAIQGAATIALAKPKLVARIVAAILAVEHAVYETEECRNVVLGHAILALDGMFPVIEDRDAVLAFVRAQLDNPRAATRKKAERFFKRRF